MFYVLYISSFRKRSRSREDDMCEGEFFPLSKRINNLHLSASTISSIQNNQYSQQIIQQQPIQANNNQMPQHQTYAPDLKEHDNPHYYNKNKILYDLFVQRSRRHDGQM